MPADASNAASPAPPAPGPRPHPVVRPPALPPKGLPATRRTRLRNHRRPAAPPAKTPAPRPRDQTRRQNSRRQAGIGANVGPGRPGALVERIWAVPVFVRDGLSGREAVSALDVELDSPLAFVGRAADEVSRLEFGVGGEPEVAEALIPAVTPLATEDRSRYWTF